MTEKSPLDTVWLVGSLTLFAAVGYGAIALGEWPPSRVLGGVAGTFALLVLAGTVRAVRRRRGYQAVLGGLVVVGGLAGLATAGTGLTSALVTMLGVALLIRAARGYTGSETQHA